MKYIWFCFIALLFSFQARAQCDELKPMYGDNCVRTTKQQKADNQFRRTAIKQHGSLDSATGKLVRTGWKLFKNREEGKAMQQFNQAWLLNPEDPNVYFAFGHLTRYAFNKNAADAERYYNQGRMRDPNHGAEQNSLLRLITVLDNQKDPEMAIDVSSQLIQRFPEFGNGYGYKKRAYYYTNLQMPDRAILDFEKALQLDPNDAQTYVGRGYAYSWQRHHDKALADYAKAISLDPKFVNAYTNRAILYADSLKQPALALPDIEKALQLNPKNPDHYLVKSNILFKMNRKKEACACLKDGLALGNKSLAAAFKEKCGK